jgi:hypothetical protein
VLLGFAFRLRVCISTLLVLDQVEPASRWATVPFANRKGTSALLEPARAVCPPILTLRDDRMLFLTLALYVGFYVGFSTEVRRVVYTLTTITLEQKYHRRGTSLALFRVFPCCRFAVSGVLEQYFFQICRINTTLSRTRCGINLIC